MTVEQVRKYVEGWDLDDCASWIASLDERLYKKQQTVKRLRAELKEARGAWRVTGRRRD